MPDTCHGKVNICIDAYTFLKLFFQTTEQFETSIQMYAKHILKMAMKWVHRTSVLIGTKATCQRCCYGGILTFLVGM